jgi:hypothetical protein
MVQKQTLGTEIKGLKEVISKIEEKKIDLSMKFGFTDFRSAEKKYFIDSYKLAISNIKKIAQGSMDEELKKAVNELSIDDFNKSKIAISRLEKFDNISKNEMPKRFSSSKIPEEIKNDVEADLIELEKCFNHECYRSCVILCGRIIEVCLHAKYFQATGFDILEKNPGIGLGTLIAKMEEKNIKLDPGLTQQIHLINNVRIFSVHKKQRTFYPSKEQTQAIILYTKDVINRLF